MNLLISFISLLMTLVMKGAFYIERYHIKLQSLLRMQTAA